ncbi:hypothetical protein ACHQM5_014035 [Ranunculus cassubicifolius]
MATENISHLHISDEDQKPKECLDVHSAHYRLRVSPSVCEAPVQHVAEASRCQEGFSSNVVTAKIEAAYEEFIKKMEAKNREGLLAIDRPSVMCWYVHEEMGEEDEDEEMEEEENDTVGTKFPIRILIHIICQELNEMEQKLE